MCRYALKNEEYNNSCYSYSMRWLTDWSVYITGYRYYCHPLLLTLVHYWIFLMFHPHFTHLLIHSFIHLPTDSFIISLLHWLFWFERWVEKPTERCRASGNKLSSHTRAFNPIPRETHWRQVCRHGNDPDWLSSTRRRTNQRHTINLCWVHHYWGIFLLEFSRERIFTNSARDEELLVTLAAI